MFRRRKRECSETDCRGRERGDCPGTADDLKNREREGEGGESVSDVEHVECYVGCRVECM